MEAVLLGPADRDALAALFEEIAADGSAASFHPHPFTPAQAASICERKGRDAYLALREGGRFVAYGMLRGWDEGYDVPSLGIYVARPARGRGVGRVMMERLHAAARERGAIAVRLKVYEDNVAARRLYESLGYVFGEREGDQCVGVLRLAG